jgi:signal transduction histidine kinase/CheY-like chemotaxis protein
MTSPEELVVAAEELPVAIWMGKVPSGEVVYTNRAFREVLGIEPPPGAARGAFVEPYGVHHLDGRPYPEDAMPFEACIRARALVVLDDLVIHRRDGRKVNLRVFAKPIFDADGKLTHVLEAFTDITREVEAERARVDADRKLSRSQRLESIGQLVAGIAHDFNNLLTVTKLAVNQLLPSERDPMRREALGDVQSVTDSAIALVKNLLGFAGRSRHVLAPLEVTEVVESVVDLTRRTFDRRITVRFERSGACWIHGDRAQVEQIMMNVLVNARDAIPESGQIGVSVGVRALAEDEVDGCPAGRYVVIEVTDDGVGIDPSIRDRIFEPYFTTKTLGPIKGTGLGLSTVHGIVQAHAGFVDARPAPPRDGRGGTTLRVAIPETAPPPDDAKARAQAPRAQAPRAHGELVLLADDERLVRAATARSLEAQGYRVIEVDSGAHALEVFAARSDEIAAVVLDMVMPGMTTREIYAALRERRADVPVLVITGSAMNDELRALADMGIKGWLAKPFSEEQLGASLLGIRG